MKKSIQSQELNDILVDENSVASFSYTAYQNGTLELHFTINDPQGFHGSDASKNDMNDLIEAALQASKDKLNTYTAPTN